MKIRLTANTFVRLNKDVVMEVDDSEGTRLIALRTAEKVEEPKEEKKAKKKAGK